MPKVAKSRQKLTKVAKSCQKLTKVDKSCQKSPKVDKSCQKSPYINVCHKLNTFSSLSSPRAQKNITNALFTLFRTVVFKTKWRRASWVLLLSGNLGLFVNVPKFVLFFGIFWLFQNFCFFEGVRLCSGPMWVVFKTKWRQAGFCYYQAIWAVENFYLRSILLS